MKDINHLTLANLEWLRDVAIPTSKLRINQQNLDIVMRGKALIMNQDMEHLGCYSCSARSYFSVSKSVLEQYESAVLTRISELSAEGGETEKVIENNTQESNEFNDLESDVHVEPATKTQKKTKKEKSILESWTEKDSTNEE